MRDCVCGHSAYEHGPLGAFDGDACWKQVGDFHCTCRQFREKPLPTPSRTDTSS